MSDDDQVEPDDEQPPAGTAGDRRRDSNTDDRPGTDWLSGTAALLLGLMVWAVVGTLVLSIWSDGAARLRDDHWREASALTAGLLILFGFARTLESRFEGMQPAKRRIALVFLTVPLIAFAVLGIGLLAAEYAAFVLQMVFILVTALFPAGVYYLFLNMRRASILNEFVSNLGRLGLLGPRERVGASGERSESDQEWRARVDGYLQRFEAVYGPLRFRSSDGRTQVRREDFVLALATSREPGDLQDEPSPSPTATVLLADIFRANLLIPLGLVTVLCALGWLLVLQPVWIPAGEEPGTAPAAATAPEQRGAEASAADRIMTGLLRSAVAADETPVVPADRASDDQMTASGTEQDSTSTPPPACNDTMVGCVVTAAEQLRLEPHWTPVNFAFLGAWFFGLQAIIRRFMRRDLGPNAYLGLATRLLLAAVAAWVLVASWQVIQGGDLHAIVDETDWPPGLLVTAFVIGVFPRVLWQIIGTALAKLPGVGLMVPGLQAKLPLADLDGLTVWHETRLEEEDIENVPNMATADIVDLMLHTQIPAERLVSWVDQAILYTVIGASDAKDPMIARLRSLGLRSATQLVHVWMAASTGGAGRPGARARAAADDASGANATPDLLADGRLPFIVQAIQVEANFAVVRAWRGV